MRRSQHQSTRALRRAAQRQARKETPEPRSTALDKTHVRILTPEEVEAREYHDKIQKAALATRDMGLVIPGQEQ